MKRRHVVRDASSPRFYCQHLANVCRPQDNASPLVHGERLDQKTFHERYEAMPHVRAELIGGIVYMASPQKRRHSRSHPLLLRWLDECEEHTPGVERLANPTEWVAGAEHGCSAPVKRQLVRRFTPGLGHRMINVCRCKTVR